MMPPTDPPAPDRPKRRVRYSGKNPRRFDEKYKERDPVRYAADVAKVVAGGKTPAGSHRPIMVAEILEALALRPGGIVVDCTLGYGGHARELLAQVVPRLSGIPPAAEAATTDGAGSPGATFSEVTTATTGAVPQGRLIGLDVDPIEQPKTIARLRDAGFGEDVFTPVRRNFAGLPQVLAELGSEGRDPPLADPGLPPIQPADPPRGLPLERHDLRLRARDVVGLAQRNVEQGIAVPDSPRAGPGPTPPCRAPHPSPTPPLAPACPLPRPAWVATRTSARAASGNASASRSRSRAIRPC